MSNQNDCVYCECTEDRVNISLNDAILIGYSYRAYSALMSRLCLFTICLLMWIGKNNVTAD